MKGWRRDMTFQDTGLNWIPQAPMFLNQRLHFFTRQPVLWAELHLVNIGVGYTLPFKVVGAPWIDARKFAHQLNGQKFPGVHFSPFHYRPFFGRFSGQDCHGVLILITDPQAYLPVTTQYLLLGMLKSLYPTHFKKAIEASSERQEMFNKVNGTGEVFRILKEENYFIWKLRTLHQKEREDYLKKRSKYFLYS